MHLSTILPLEFGNVPRVWYYFHFILLERHTFVPTLQRSEWLDGKSLWPNNSQLCAYIQQWRVIHQRFRPSIFWQQTNHIFPNNYITWRSRPSIFWLQTSNLCPNNSITWWSRPSIFWLQTSNICPNNSITWRSKPSIFWLQTNPSYFS